MDFMTSLIDLVLGDIWDRLGENIQKRKAKSDLQRELAALAERHRPAFEQLDLQAEYDWEGLNQFLKDQISAPKDSMFLGSLNLPERLQRERAWKNFLSRAQQEAGAKTCEAKQAVYQYVKLFREVITNFFLEQIDDRTLFLCGHMAEDILQETDALLRTYQNELMEAIDYHNSFAQFLDNIQMPEDLKNPLHYRNTLLRFQGRKQELQHLRQFLDCEDEIRWMAFVGNGGLGKSKLLYHFVQEVEAYPEWKVCWLSANLVKKLSNYTSNLKHLCKILLVVDYAGESAQQLGSWLDQAVVSNSRPEKIRVLLLERETILASPAGLPINPQWYEALLGNFRQARTIKRLCYGPTTGEPFWALSPLSDEELKGLVVDYARARGKEAPGARKQDRILQWARKIDRSYGQPRPLVVLMTADAVLDGKSGNQWNIENLSEHILIREQQHWETVVGENNVDLYQAVLEVLAYATAVGGWKLGERLSMPLTEPTGRLCSLQASKAEPLVSALNQQNSPPAQVLPLEPDLIGEYFVLDQWSEHRYDRAYLSQLFSLLWQKPAKFAGFLARSISDYYGNCKFQWLFGNGMELLQPAKENLHTITYYAMLLVNLSNKQLLEDATQTIERLRTLSEQHPDSSDFAMLYANGLFNLFNKQSLEEATQTTENLHALSDQHPHFSDFALLYAKGLVNLSNKQPLEDAAGTLEHLRALSEQHPDSSDFALLYAKGLFNLSNRQPLGNAAEMLEHLRAISKQHPNFPDFALLYAKGLVNLSNKQPLEDAIQTTNNLRPLFEQYPNSLDFALVYATGLLNLSNKQPPEDAIQTINNLRSLFEQYPHSSDFALLYANALVNLSNNQSLEDAIQTIEQLRTLSEQHPDSSDVALAYAKGLVILSAKQPLADAAQTIRSLQVLSEQHPDSSDVALLYANGLVNLSAKQPLADANQTIRSLQALSEQHPDSSDVALAYAKGLVILSAKQPLADAAQTIRSLQVLSEQHPDFSDVALLYANGLVNLSVNQPLADANQTIRSLQVLSEQHPDFSDVALAYAKGLVNLSNNQSLEDAIQTIEQLRTFSEQYSDSSDFALVYATGLFTLSIKQSLDDTTLTIERLRTLSEQHPHSSDFALVYAKGLVILFFKDSTLCRLADTRKQLEKLAEKHADQRQEIETLLDYLSDPT